MDDFTSPYLTVEQVAQRWQCRERTVREMLGTGELTGFKIRNAWRIALTAVLDYESRSVTHDISVAECINQYRSSAVITKIT